MLNDVQKPNLWKRISAALLDLVLIFVAIEGLVLLFTSVFGYNSLVERRNEIEAKYISDYGIVRDMTEEELNAMPEDAQNAYKAKVEAANKAYQSDEEVIWLFGQIMSLSLMISTLSILISFALLEFAVPLMLGNGQTLGKKVFGIGVMRVDGVKVQPIAVFARGILGKCTIGTLIPVYLVIMVFFGLMGMVGVVTFFGLFILQIALFIFTKYHTPIHDKFAQTVTVDMTTQVIYDSVEEMLESKKRAAAEAAEKSDY